PDVPAEPLGDGDGIDPTSVSAALDDLPVSGLSVMHVPSAGLTPEATAPAAASGTVPPSGEETMRMLSLAGGSFAAALTPPPDLSQIPEVEGESLGETQTLGPPPWDPASGAPPPLKAQDDQWSVGGPPPLKAAPPPVKKPEDDIAAALGLPQLQ